MAKNQKTYTPEFKQQIVDLHCKAGKGVTELSNEYGIPKGTVSTWIKNLAPAITTEEETISLKEYNGKEITPNYLTKKFHTLIEKQNDFPQIRFHDLRHSVASNLLNDGFTTVQVAEWLGHSSSTTTLKFYAHIDKTSKLAIANSLQAD